MLWFYLALGASFLWALDNLIHKYLLDKFNKESVVVFLFTSFSMAVLVGLVFPIRFSGFALLAGFFWVLSYYFYFRGLSESDVSRAIALLLLYPIFTAIISALFLNEQLFPLQYLGIVLAVLGAMLLSFEGWAFRRGALWMIGSGFFTALSDISTKAATHNVTVIEAFFWNYAAFIPVALLLFLIWRKRISVPSGRLALLFFLAGAFSVMASLLFITSISLTYVALPTAVGTVQPVFVLALVTLLNKVRPGWFQEDSSKKSLLVKLVALALLSTGVFLVVF